MASAKSHKRTVLVTGGAGFIGFHPVMRLVEQGERVQVLDNFSNGFSENLDRIDKALSVAQ